VVEGSRLGVIEYIGVGDFEVEEVQLVGSRIEVATHRDQRVLVTADVRAILDAAVEVMGRLPEDVHGRVVIAVPRSFLSSGSAGARSVVQPAAPRPVAHEILHWWIGSELTADDAGWFQEGVTTYYAATICRRAGLWSRAQEEGCLADLAAEARFLSRTPARGLARLELRRSRRESNLLYARGAVVTAWLDRRLEARGETLDRFVRTVVFERRGPLDSRRLLEIFGELYGTELADQLGGYLFESRSIPDLDLPDATGRSGCAGLLPDDLSGER
jgi:hypothetical protein